MCSFDFVCSELNFFDRCARSPRDFENHRAVAERRLGRISSERRRLFKTKRLRSSRKLLKAVWAEFWKMNFFLEEINLSEGLLRGISFFSRCIRKEQSCSITSGCVSRHKLLASLRLELEESIRWAAGAHGRATRATCVRGTFILEDETQRRKGRQHGYCRLADWAQGLSLCDWGNKFSHTKIYPHSRHL